MTVFPDDEGTIVKLLDDLYGLEPTLYPSTSAQMARVIRNLVLSQSGRDEGPSHEISAITIRRIKTWLNSILEEFKNFDKLNKDDRELRVKSVVAQIEAFIGASSTIINQAEQKRDAYRELVSMRKRCRDCDGVANCSDFPNDINEIGPWSKWQGNLFGEIMVVGQDWGDEGYYERNGPNEPPGNPTNKMLMELLKSIHVNIDPPDEDGSTSKIFLTNAVLCLKKGKGLQAKVDPQWFRNCGKKFLKPLIELIGPKIVISLGAHPLNAIVALYNIKRVPLRDAVDRSRPIRLSPETVLFPMYHCGARTINGARSKSQQLDDWKRVSDWMDAR